MMARGGRLTLSGKRLEQNSGQRRLWLEEQERMESHRHRPSQLGIDDQPLTPEDDSWFWGKHFSRQTRRQIPAQRNILYHRLQRALQGPESLAEGREQNKAHKYILATFPTAT